MKTRRTMLLGAACVLAACSSGSGGGGSSTPTVPDWVKAQADGKVTEVEPGIWVDSGTKMILGACDKVKPYVKVHGKPGGFICK